MGKAAPARIDRIVMVTMSSTSVRPCSAACGRRALWLRAGVSCSIVLLLPDRDAGLSALRRHSLPGGGTQGDARGGECGGAGNLGLERQDADHSLAVHSGCSGRTRDGDGEIALAVVAMSDLGSLAVPVEQA